MLSCKRKDHNKPPNYSMTPVDSPPPTPFVTFTSDDVHYHDIVPQQSPTLANNRYSYSEASEDEIVTSEDERSNHHRRDSQAARYLRQFQSPASLSERSNRTPRPHYNRSSTSNAAFSNAPSLSHTPASSTASTSIPYTPSARPLPPRTNPHSTSWSSKSVDLVTPFTKCSSMHMTSVRGPDSFTTLTGLKTHPISTTTTATGTAAGEMLSYEKKASIPSISPGQGSLKQLLISTETPAS